MTTFTHPWTTRCLQIGPPAQYIYKKKNVGMMGLVVVRRRVNTVMEVCISE